MDVQLSESLSKIGIRHLSRRESRLFVMTVVLALAGVFAMAILFSVQCYKSYQHPVATFQVEELKIFPDDGDGNISFAFVDVFRAGVEYNAAPPDIEMAWSGGSELWTVDQVRSKLSRIGGNRTWTGRHSRVTIRWFYAHIPFVFTSDGVRFHKDAECRQCTYHGECSVWATCRPDKASQDWIMTNNVAAYAQGDSKSLNVPKVVAWPSSMMQYNNVGYQQRNAIPTYGHAGGGFYVIPFLATPPSFAEVANRSINPDAARQDADSLDIVYPAWVQLKYPSGSWIIAPENGVGHLAETHELGYIGKLTLTASQRCHAACKDQAVPYISSDLKAFSYTYNPYGHTGTKIEVDFKKSMTISHVQFTLANLVAQLSSIALSALSFVNFFFPSQAAAPRFFKYGEVPAVHLKMYEENFAAASALV